MFLPVDTYQVSDRIETHPGLHPAGSNAYLHRHTRSRHSRNSATTTDENSKRVDVDRNTNITPERGRPSYLVKNYAVQFPLLLVACCLLQIPIQTPNFARLDNFGTNWRAPLCLLVEAHDPHTHPTPLTTLDLFRTPSSSVNLASTTSPQAKRHECHGRPVRQHHQAPLRPGRWTRRIQEGCRR